MARYCLPLVLRLVARDRRSLPWAMAALEATRQGTVEAARQIKSSDVVVIFQENRTPDNLFHGLPNADIANSGVNSLAQTIPRQPIPLANRYDLGHRDR